MPFSSSPKVLVLLNHQLTAPQIDAGLIELGTSSFVYPPSDISNIWCNISPSLLTLSEVLKPIITWLQQHGKPRDFLLVQGDFGATLLLVQHAWNRGMVPVYSTTERATSEEAMPCGAVTITRTYRHVLFRRYENVNGMDVCPG